jgi:enoyl-CoA hydratase/carnithine racemase
MNDGYVKGNLELTQDGRIAVATLNCPPENELNQRTFELLNSALDVFESSEADLVIITGRGSFFSKGFDVDVIRSITDPEELRSNLVSTNFVVNRLANLSKPVIAAINGHCFGGGLELALACHFRICVEKVRLGLPEVSIGLIPGFGGIHRLCALIGRAKAIELVAMGDLITADEALRLNLVNRVVPRKGFMDHVLSFAKALLMVEPSLLSEVIDLANGAGGGSEGDDTTATIESFVRTALNPPGQPPRA